jgi:hypothetical protein
MERLEICHPPKQGCWLNMAEIEIGVMSNSGLSERIQTIEQLRRETTAWAIKRKESVKKMTWMFTTADAWVKLASSSSHNYPLDRVLAHSSFVSILVCCTS